MVTEYLPGNHGRCGVTSVCGTPAEAHSSDINKEVKKHLSQGIGGKLMERRWDMI